MSITTAIANAEGRWVGEAKLYLPGDPVRTTPSRAEIRNIANGKFVTITYDWSFEGEPQSGLLLVGLESENGPAAGSFVDSWHMGDKLMACRGQATPTGLSVLGHYSVEGYPDWGWRTEVLLEPNLRVKMYNVSPEGEETLGFVLEYAGR